MSAQAALTPINDSGNANGAERCLAGVLCAQGSYGGSVSILRAYEIDHGLAAGSLQRVDDAGDRDWMLVSAEAAVRPLARYAGDESRLGLFSGGALSILTPTMPKSELRVGQPALFGADPHASDFRRLGALWYGLTAPSDVPFAFVLQNLTASLLLSSNTALAGFSNTALAQDWMVTWRVPGQDRYLIAWEDRSNVGADGLPNDYDYNDFVIEVRGAIPYPGGGELPVVPLPPALGLLLAGLGAIAAAARLAAARRAR